MTYPLGDLKLDRVIIDISIPNNLINLNKLVTGFKTSND